MSKLLTGVSFSLAVAVASLGGAAPASAAILLSEPGVSTFLPTPGSYTYTFDATADGAGSISFGLVGRGTIDGQGATCGGALNCEDTFTLILNGDDLFQGLFRMGGLGVDLVLFSPNGTTVSSTSGAFGDGGTASLVLPAAFRQGQNFLTFVYTGIDQGMDDEAWAIADLTVRDNVAVVPEPSSWALMIAGFGLAGAALRRRAAWHARRPA